MGRPIQFKNYGLREPSEIWKVGHHMKPRLRTANTSTNGECKVIKPADPAKVAAYRASTAQ